MVVSGLIFVGGCALSAYSAIKTAEKAKVLINAALDQTEVVQNTVRWGGVAVKITKSADHYLFCDADEACVRVISRGFPASEWNKEARNMVKSMLKESSLSWSGGDDIGLVPHEKGVKKEVVVRLKGAIYASTDYDRFVIFRFAQRVVALSKGQKS